MRQGKKVMSKTMSWDDLESIDLRDLLDARALQTLQGDPQDNAKQSLAHLAQESLGWQSWAREQDIPLAGSPIVLTQQAARHLGASVAEANAIYAQAQAQPCIPEAKAKGGDAACWSRIAQLDPQLYWACRSGPESDQQFSQQQAPESAAPAPRAVLLRDPLRSTPPQETATSTAEPRSVNPSAPTATAERPTAETLTQPGIRVQVEQDQPSFLSPQQQRDREFATLGRKIVSIAGIENGENLAFEGKANYTITVNLNTNTMRITSQDRGDKPILIDANGNIDHQHSQVNAKDVEKFQAALQFLNQRQQGSAVGQDR